MKKIVSILVALLLIFTVGVSIADVKIPQDVMNAAIKNEDATGIIQNYLYPYLETDDTIALMFASELNISNGCPHTFGRSLFTGGWGERAMFGRLITASTVLKYLNTDNVNPHMDNAYLADCVRAETYRMLLGKPYNDLFPNKGWLRTGNTKFKFTYLAKGKVLDYATGKFVKTDKTIWVIKVSHTTEYYGDKHAAYITCDWKHVKDGYYTASFSIARY